MSLNCKVLRCVGCGKYEIVIENQDELRFGWSHLNQFICDRCNYVKFPHYIEDQIPSSLLKCGRCLSIIGVITCDTITPFGPAGVSKTYLTSNCEKCIKDGELLEETIKRISYVKIVDI